MKIYTMINLEHLHNVDVIVGDTELPAEAITEAELDGSTDDVDGDT